MKIPYLGKIRFHWCDSCNVPLIRRKCSLCGNLGRKVLLSPPGDVRPAFKDDILRMISCVRSQFGEASALRFKTLVKDQMVLFNKVPYVDRMDEIIIHGHIIGLFRYNIIKKNFEILPKLFLAKEIWAPQSLKSVIVDKGARTPIIKGASVLSPGVILADQNISVDDPVFVVSNDEVIAVGLAKKTGEEMNLKGKGIAVKTKYRKFVSYRLSNTKSANWNRIIDANKDSLESLESEAIDFIGNIAAKFKKHVVAYSGGKDSLVTLDLVNRSGFEYDIIFSDTGLEYPETLENIELISHKYNKSILINDNESWNFWERFDHFGPPSRDSRWCCKSAKLFPINELLESHFSEQKEVLTYIGRRRYESLGRSQEPRISRNPWIPKQISASPIKSWNAFEIFLYIHRHHLNQYLNPLYERGFIRIGCWVCPASSMSDFNITNQSHPELIKKLERELNKIQARHEFPSQYVSWGLWRWKFLPKKIVELLRMNKISISKLSTPTESSNNELRFKITDSPSPCVQGGFSTFVSSNQILDLQRVSRLSPILGFVSYNDELDILSITGRNQEHIDIFRDGSIIIRDKTESKLFKQIKTVIKTLFRVLHCDGCGICTYQCSQRALQVDSDIIKVLEDSCNQCLKCNDYCPILRYLEIESFCDLEKDRKTQNGVVNVAV